MRSIRVLSPTLQLLGEIHDYESLVFNFKHHKSGDFQLTINLNKQYTN